MDTNKFYLLDLDKLSKIKLILLDDNLSKFNNI